MSGLTEKVKQWISDQGYPLEMLVAKQFRQVGGVRSTHFTITESAF